MIAHEVKAILDALDYTGADGLITSESLDVAPNRSYVWHEVQDKFGLDAAYFHGDIPVIYFKGLDSPSDDELALLHRRLWNHSRAPLFVAILPEEVRIYNCFAPPARNTALRLSDPPILATVRSVVDIVTLQQQLSSYRRAEVESGRLARAHAGEFRRDRRAHQRLLDNIGEVRLALLQRGLEDHVVNNLIGRSIFIRYLEDRGVLGNIFFSDYAQASSYTDLLHRSLLETYQLFSFLAHKFNGDMFPVDDRETQSVTADHLDLLGSFLSGTEIASGQMYFWAYDFKYIPIELISSIYEDFLHAAQAATGAYYTPPEIVDFVLNEMLPWDGDALLPRILDPACGSGIFLVEAYRRLIERRRRYRGQRLSVEELSSILTQAIYGVDINVEAVRVTAFSLYLALLDVLEPKSIWTQVRFPRLIGSNLFVFDFFDMDAPFNLDHYDIIVGNPPWQSHLSRAALRYVSQAGRPVGDKQLAQVFLWRFGDLLESAGRACLLAPSKGMLFNKSGPNAEFRRQFFAFYAVTIVADFSAFRRTLFPNARAPMVALFYRHLSTSTESKQVRHYAPRPSPLGESLAGVVIAGDEIHTFSRSELSRHPDIWKIALWGTARDLALIETLRARFPTLDEIARRRHWTVGQGVQAAGGDKNYAPELGAMTFIPVDALRPFRVMSEPKRIGTDTFHRQRDPALFKGPHLLLRKGLLRGGVIAAALVPYDAVFHDSIFALAAAAEDNVILKILCAYLNSSLARYYYFLTSSSWGVEREQIQLNEYLTLPCAIPLLGDYGARRLTTLVDTLQDLGVANGLQRELDDVVFDAYELTAAERHLVLDTVEMTIDLFSLGTRSRVFDQPSPEDLVAYAEAFTEVLNGAITSSGDAFRATVYKSSSPYRALEFALTKRDDYPGEPRVEMLPQLDHVLSSVGDALLNQHAQSVYLRRNVKAFGTDTIHILKPAERRYWSRSAGYNDADEMVAHLLRVAQPVG